MIEACEAVLISAKHLMSPTAAMLVGRETRLAQVMLFLMLPLRFLFRQPLSLPNSVTGHRDQHALLIPSILVR